jgi:hypothetical protein
MAEFDSRPVLKIEEAHTLKVYASENKCQHDTADGENAAKCPSPKECPGFVPIAHLCVGYLDVEEDRKENERSTVSIMRAPERGELGIHSDHVEEACRPNPTVERKQIFNQEPTLTFFLYYSIIFSLLSSIREKAFN